MRILVLAPHPFFQERGTPIDVLLVLRVLSERRDTKVDLVVYNEGTAVDLPGLTMHRTRDFSFIRNIRPGFSAKKLVCDVLLFFRAWSLVRKNRYDVIHAGEESVFFAMFFRLIYQIPYAYDLDSSIAQQLVEKKPFLGFLAPLFNGFERRAIQGAAITFPVCNALAELCENNNAKKIVTLHDISQLRNPDAASTGALKRELGIDKLILLYIGNLEPYQGIDLLLESFQIACKKVDNLDLAIIGGMTADIDRYREKASQLEIDGRVHFMGPRPFERLDEYLCEADILACPRIRGVNTPMKIFPYLHSGKPVLATDLYTHNQLLSKEEVMLAAPNPDGYSQGMIALAQDESLRKRLGEQGRSFVELGHTYSAHQERLNTAYDWLESRIGM